MQTACGQNAHIQKI
uniref:Uncharacterized protein n=1 Tax=Anguilla anguilla TaxID=7936 RepID=A0A0E9VJT1_ANGAN